MNPSDPRREKRLIYDTRVLLHAFAVGLPGGLVALLLIWFGDFSLKAQWTLTVFVVGFWWGIAAGLRNKVIFPLHTVSNLLAALREGDFSIRARGARRMDALGDVMLEMNALTQTLRDQRMDALEATALLRQIMDAIDVAIFAFDPDHKLRLVNRAGERLLGRPIERLTGVRAEDLGLDECLTDVAPRVLDRPFPGDSGRWEARRSVFRSGGLPFQLLVLTDVSRAMRQEERKAWQRLIRVLSHELNNSLTPIQSIAGSLEGIVRLEERPDDWEEDLRRGLGVISSRSESLTRFLDSYARLARLPEPTLEQVDLGALVRRVVRLETRAEIGLEPGSDIEIRADHTQLEQALINLLRNAVDACMSTGGGVRTGWIEAEDHVEVWIEDDGPGIPNAANLFVPFYSTKPGGSGIGLVLSRQIAEAHHGSLSVANREDAHGVRANLRLPRYRAAREAN